MKIQLPNMLMLFAWVFALASLVLISSHLTNNATHLVGIADDQEQTIRFTEPVEIVSLGFAPGETVQHGDLILTVRQPGLEAELGIIEEQIQAQQFGDRESRTTLLAEVEQIRADLQEKVINLDSKIREARSSEQATRAFLAGIDSAAGNQIQASTGIEAEINSLANRKAALQRAAHSRIKDIESRLQASQRPVDARIAELQQRAEALLRQKSNLQVSAQINGRVGSVMFQPGETVPPYRPILTIHGNHPAFIRAYIHENSPTDIRLNQTVWVSSANSRSTSNQSAQAWYPAKVESLGARIVEYPERLKVNPLVNAWGREVVVRLEGHHTLMLGEKVQVELKRPTSITMDVSRMFVEAR